MKKLLYYPDFEVQNSNWLKFALLYFPNLSTIIPHEGEPYLSELYRKINSSTDFFKKVQPNYDVSWTSSKETINMVTDILEKPSRYFPTYRGKSKMLEWQDLKSQTYTVFRGKYKHEFEEFCLQEKLAHKTYEGIAMSKELANIFMTNLANNLEARENYSLITKEQKYNEVSLLAKANWKSIKNDQTEMIEFAQSVIELSVPTNLVHLTFDSIIKIRNKPNYIYSLNCFSSKLEEFYNSNNENNISNRKFLESLNQPYQEIIGELLAITGTIGSVALGFYINSNNPCITVLENSKMYFEAITVMGIGTSVYNRFMPQNTNKGARNFVAQIKKL